MTEHDTPSTAQSPMVAARVQAVPPKMAPGVTPRPPETDTPSTARQARRDTPVFVVPTAEGPRSPVRAVDAQDWADQLEAIRDSQISSTSSVDARKEAERRYPNHRIAPTASFGYRGFMNGDANGYARALAQVREGLEALQLEDDDAPVSEAEAAFDAAYEDVRRLAVAVVDRLEGKP